MREILVANEGYVYTNGEIYGTKIYLAIGTNKDSFYQITKQEYKEIMKKQEEEAMINE